MLVFETLDQIDFSDYPQPVCLTIGVFDGLHLGHRALVTDVVEKARRDGGTSAVFTFCEHPLRTLAPPHAPPRLISTCRRRCLLEELGVEVLIEIPFTRDFAALTPLEFVRDILEERCGVAYLTCGSQFRFGRDGEGDVAFLEKHGEAHGFEVNAVQELQSGASTASSTSIRDLVLRGKVERAAEALCRPYELEGIVVRGDQRGRTIGYPTANIEPIERLVVPANGVYACWAMTWPKDRSRTIIRPSMTNIGSRPTFSGRENRVETHLFDFEGDLYDVGFCLAFIQKLRDEKTFDGPEKLKKRLENDESDARAILERSPNPWGLPVE